MKERIFGLAGPEGNHGEDAKEYWWYLDSTPTHSYMRWRYHYPQSRFPYGDLVRANGARGRAEPEFELVDTGIFDEDRYWAVTVDYAKAVADRYVRAHHDREPRAPRRPPCTCCRRCGSATPGPGACPAGTTCRRSTATTRAPGRPSTASSAGWCWPARTRREAAGLRQRVQRRAAVGADQPVAVPQGRHQRLHCGRSADGEPGPGRHQGGAALHSGRSGRRHAPDPAAAGPGGRPADEWSPESAARSHAALDLGRGFDRVHRPTASARRTSSSPR